MKTIFLISAFLLSQLCLAHGQKFTATIGAPVPIEYSLNNSQSMLFQCNGNVVEVLNNTSSLLGLGFGTAAKVPLDDYLFVPVGPSTGHRFKPQGGISNGSWVYVRGANASQITTGDFEVSCYQAVN